jgi:tRNA pseudouridine38-40 synthase
VLSRLLIEYDGAGFSGWARQPGARTVQASLEDALCTVLRVPAMPLTVAGRTDAGVHASGQVASYAAEAVDPRSLNALLPDDVAVLACEPAAAGFDARRDATSRGYRYRVLARRQRSALLAGRVWHWPGPVDREALAACAAALPGEHDFTAFTPAETYHVRFRRRVLTAFWQPSPVDPDVLEFWIEADAFMRQMNRILAGTMIDVAAGRRTVESFVELLAGAPRTAAGRTAPAHGLCLVGVGYRGQPVLQPGGITLHAPRPSRRGAT